MLNMDYEEERLKIIVNGKPVIYNARVHTTFDTDDAGVAEVLEVKVGMGQVFSGARVWVEESLEGLEKVKGMGRDVMAYIEGLRGRITSLNELKVHIRTHTNPIPLG